MRLGMRPRVIATALSLLGAGCATEEWTANLFTKRLAEVDETLADHGQRIDRVEGRVARLEVAVTETRDQVLEAPATAPAEPAPRVTSWRTARAATHPAERVGLVAVIHVPFGFNRADLDANAETALASLMKELREHPGVMIDLEGTTDSIGQYEYNVRLSRRRVAAVTRWLMEKGVDRSRIIGATSRGPLADASVKDSAKRRVMVKLMTPLSDK